VISFGAFAQRSGVLSSQNNGLWNALRLRVFFQAPLIFSTFLLPGRFLPAGVHLFGFFWYSFHAFSPNRLTGFPFA